MKKIIGCQIEEEVIARMDEVAKTENRNRSQLIAVAIAEYLAKQPQKQV